MYNNSVEEAANGDVIDKQYAPIKDAKNWSIEIPENAKEAVYVMFPPGRHIQHSLQNYCVRCVGFHAIFPQQHPNTHISGSLRWNAGMAPSPYHQ